MKWLLNVTTLLLIGLGAILIGHTSSASEKRKSLDLDSYCAGLCRARYQDGEYRHGECACMDYIPVNLSQRFITPKRAKVDPAPVTVYDGADEMHIPSDSN